jgi:predicted GNAT family acetyltransferase
MAHRGFVVSAGDACRYPAEVAPFAAIAEPGAASLSQLHSLLVPGESVWVIGDDQPSGPELSVGETLMCLQMVLCDQVAPPDPAIEIVRLTDANAAEMVALTTLAFPGFFRRRTCEMGSYYGVRAHGELIAMGGERLRLDGYTEISAVCTHPAHRGKGYAANLIRRLAQDHQRDGIVSWLHVSADNHPATRLYLGIGFRTVREIAAHRIFRRG